MQKRKSLQRYQGKQFLNTSLIFLAFFCTMFLSTGVVHAATFRWANPSSGSYTGGITEDVAIPPVQEPSSLLFFGVGIVGIIGYGWRQRKKAVA